MPIEKGPEELAALDTRIAELNRTLAAPPPARRVSDEQRRALAEVTRVLDDGETIVADTPATIGRSDEAAGLGAILALAAAAAGSIFDVPTGWTQWWLVLTDRRLFVLRFYDKDLYSPNSAVTVVHAVAAADAHVSRASVGKRRSVLDVHIAGARYPFRMADDPGRARSVIQHLAPDARS